MSEPKEGKKQPKRYSQIVCVSTTEELRQRFLLNGGSRWLAEQLASADTSKPFLQRKERNGEAVIRMSVSLSPENKEKFRQMGGSCWLNHLLSTTVPFEF